MKFSTGIIKILNNAEITYQTERKSELYLEILN